MLKDLIFKKKIAHKLFKKITSQINYNKFSLLRAKCKSQSKIDYNIYIFNMQNSIKTNPKLFWKFFNHKKMCSTLPNTMVYDNDLFVGGSDIVDCFAHYFSSVYENQVSSTQKTKQPSTNNNSIEVNLNSHVL